jgi:hypothetical protein
MVVAELGSLFGEQVRVQQRRFSVFALLAHGQEHLVPGGEHGGMSAAEAGMPR